MKTILITGPIGSGKSEVSKYLISKGFPVYDCDSGTKALYDNVPGLKKKIEQALDIEWSGIGVIFSDSSRRQRLEDIVYPLVVDDINCWKSSLDCGICFIESAIALDKRQFDGLYDSVLLVTAGLELRKARNPKAAQRDSLQSFDKEKIDYIIENDASVEALQTKIEELLCRLI